MRQVKIDSLGPALTEDSLRHFEDASRVRLPKDYRAFLLSTNGGVPTPDTIDVADAPGSPTDIQAFFGIGRIETTSNLDWNAGVIEERGIGPDFLPFACDSGGNLFCFRVENGMAGRIWYLVLDQGPPSSHLVCADFEDFVSRIREFEC